MATPVHVLAMADYKLRYTELVFNGLETALAVVAKDEAESTIPDPDAALEEAGHILGLALVAVQNYMSEVEEIAREMRKDNAALPRFQFTDLTRRCGRIIPGTDVFDMEAIWQLANFWKHGDLWDRDWDVEARNDRSRSTIDVMRRLGINPSSYHPILLGIEKAIQVDWWLCLKPLLLRVSEWRLDALRACECLAEAP